MKRFFFYSLQAQFESYVELSLDNHYSFELWKPSPLGFVPRDSALRFIAWWVMHYLHVFANHDYGLFLIYYDKRIVHQSVITPRYFRFPFMAQNDLQIGDTWTAPEHRGKGLATFALSQILLECRKQDRKFWYVVEQDNVPSIRVIEKVGFARTGEGTRTKHCGLSILGAYVMDREI